MVKYAIILAGGTGSRAGGSLPKQFQMLGGIPVLWWSVRAFYKEDKNCKIIIVIHPEYKEVWDNLYHSMPEEDKQIPIEIASGGKDRIESVRSGLSVIPPYKEGEVLVAVHDAARPAVSRQVIETGWETAKAHGSAIPVVEMTDSMRIKGGNGESKSVDRSRYVRVQTPQVFELSILRKGYAGGTSAAFTDDASVIEAAGYKVRLYPGDERNIKVTQPVDFGIVGLLMGL